MTEHRTVRLNDGKYIPAVGLGLWRISDDEAERTVCEGVAAGYRLLDTAAFYGNETGVGRGIRACGIDRSELFITTKLWNDRHGYDRTMDALDESLAKLGLEYIDLYLIHWPVAGSELYLDSWRAFVEMRDSGLVRSIGVSNFLPHHVERLIEVEQVAPAVNQVEYHPYFQQREVAEANRRHSVVTQAWAPIGRGRAFAEPAVVRLTQKYNKTPAQIVLRWHLDEGRIAIPKSSSPERMRENIDVFDFSLTPEELRELDVIDTVYRIGDDPDVFSGVTPERP